MNPTDPGVLLRLAEVVPVSVVMLTALGTVVWLASRVVRVLDRHLNGWQDTRPGVSLDTPAGSLTMDPQHGGTAANGDNPESAHYDNRP